MASLTPRALRRMVAPWLPEPIKAPFRARLFGYRRARTGLSVAVDADERGVTARIDGRVTLRYRGEDRPDFQYHLLDNGESIEEIAGFLRVAERARTLYDVGAWKGLFSLLFCGLGQRRRAIAYEPSPTGVAAIEALARENGCADLVVRPVAVGASPGRASGRIAPDGIVSIERDASAGRAIGELALVTLDDEVASLGLAPDLLKIDVEGYEHEVLVGARRLLARHKPAICLELHLDLLERRGLSAALVIDELASHGYRFETSAGRPMTRRQLSGSAHAVIRFIAR